MRQGLSLLRVLFIFGYLISFRAFASDCEVTINKVNPKQVDVVFPNGNVVSVVGHSHPNRGSAAFHLESEVQDLLALPPRDFKRALQGRKDFRQKVIAALGDSAEALRDFSDDYKGLEAALEKSKYEYIGLETFDVGIQWHSENTANMRRNFKDAIELLKIPTRSTRSLELAAFTPQFLLRERRPTLFRGKEIFSAEPKPVEIEDYNEKNCKGNLRAFSDERKIERAKFLESLRARLPEKSVSKADRRAADKVLIYLGGLHPNLVKAKVVPQSVSDIYLNELGIKTTAQEKILLIDGFRTTVEQWNHFDGCSGRDALIARNLAQKSESGSVINYIGHGHIQALTHYLAVECDKMKKQQSIPTEQPSSVK